MLGTPLRSGRIYLMPLCSQLVTDPYLGWMNNIEITRFLEVRWNPPKTQSELVRFVQAMNESQNSFLYGIFLSESDLHIGNIKLGEIDWNNQFGYIGFFIGVQETWGQGFASESINLVLEYAFFELGLRKVLAGVISRNTASIMTLRKCGFRLEGILCNQCLLNDIAVDGLLMSISYDDFSSIKDNVCNAR